MPQLGPFIVMLLTAFALAGCVGSGANITPEDITVTSSASPCTAAGQPTLGVLPVARTASGGGFFREPIDAAVFRQGLIRTLKRNNLFKIIDGKWSPELLLQATILKDAPLDGRSIRVPIMVRYEILKTSASERVFGTDVLSAPKIPYVLSEAGLTGAKRHAQMLRAGIRDNFKKLLIRIRRVFGPAGPKRWRRNRSK